jgi:hypothetical protein
MSSSTLEQLLFKTLENGSDSWVAVCVGCAEGTRTADGRRTVAYHGHRDPANNARNQGSFSFQGTAANPEEADRKQIDKFKSVLIPVFIKAFKDFHLSDRQILELWLIACDCFVQSEIACIGEKGFIDLASAGCRSGKGGFLEWRYQAYFDPKTGKLDAPGFGNNPDRLKADQLRRIGEVSGALAPHLGAIA